MSNEQNETSSLLPNKLTLPGEIFNFDLFKQLNKEQQEIHITPEPQVDVQGYKRTLVKTADYSCYEKTVDADYLASLAKKIGLPDVKSNTFNLSFEKHRDSIINFDEMFFFHYHQLASSIQATYQKIADSQDESKENLEKMKQNVDKALNSAWINIQKKCNKKFQSCLKKSLNKDGSINIQKLNENLNKSIKEIKKESDKEFKEKLDANSCYVYSSPKRTGTSAFGGETLMKTTYENGLTTEVQSTPVTAHSENKGPSISKITMRKTVVGVQTVLHQSYRTSHLVSDPSNKQEADAVESRISELVKQTSPSKPIIYNLYTSVYNQTEDTGFSNKALLNYDEPKNQQTKRLAILLDAQKNHNKAQTNFAKCFFTLNTPTNGYGAEISLQSGDPLIKKAAQSNIIALALMLFGHENKEVQDLITSFRDDNPTSFIKNYESIKIGVNAVPKIFNENKAAHAFLLARFKEDNAATHKFAKETATCVGIIADSKIFTLAIGCKSGHERTGNIEGRVECYHKNGSFPKEANFPDDDIEKIANFIKSGYDDTDKTVSSIHSGYNDNGLFGAASCFFSLNGQGANPKTQKTSDRKLLYIGLMIVAASIAASFFCAPVALVGIIGLAICIYELSPNTNQSENRNILTNYESSKMSKLQSHKDKEFDGLSKLEIEEMETKIKTQLKTGAYCSPLSKQDSDERSSELDRVSFGHGVAP